jgi:hypothetical protein
VYLGLIVGIVGAVCVLAVSVAMGYVYFRKKRELREKEMADWVVKSDDEATISIFNRIPVAEGFYNTDRLSKTQYSTNPMV